MRHSWLHDERWRYIGVGLFSLLTAGCSGAENGTPTNLPFPVQVGPFERVEAAVKGRSGVLAGYQLTLPKGTVIATVQRRPAPGGESLLPTLDKGPADEGAVAEAELTRSMAQIRRFYPDVSINTTESFLLLRGGQLRAARGTVVAYQEEVGGEVRTLKMDVMVVCCTEGHEVVEYRFRHNATVTAELEETAFMRNFPWTATEAKRD